MTVVPRDISQVILTTELVEAELWARRHGWRLEVAAPKLVVRAHMPHPADDKPLLLHGEFDGYRVLPPAWLFLDPDTETPTPHAWPSAGPVGDQASIFHSVGVLCAHFSRKAYTAEHGPHDWGGLTHWTQVRDGIHAETVAEMLAAIAVHLRYSPGRMG